jgi:beta-mannosidase
MNLLRIWGEGDLPPAEFYDECDRRGILVWQDFMFGYGMHPDRAEFLENCRAEIEGMIRKLRNHPCILLWVGGNENHMGFNFAQGGMPSLGQALFVKVMPEACARLDPTRLFHPSSPYGGPVPNWPLEGDWHDYSTLTFSPFASVPTFASEVGRVSAPSLPSMRRFLTDEEIWPAGFSAAIRKPGQAPWPPAWAYYNAAWEKVGAVEQYPDANSPQELIRVLGTAHGEYLQQRVERERRGVPDGGAPGNRRCWGNMVWRLNDAWPLIYWSVIDYYLEPKIPFYYLRRASEPVLVSFERTADKIAVWVVNDSPEAAAGELKVRQVRFDGTVKGELRADVRIAPGESKRCLDLTALGPISLRGEFLEAMFAGREATHLLIGERYLALPKAQLKARMLGDRIEISSSAFARQVVIEAEGATFEDNFFDLPPGRSKTLRVTGARTLVVMALNADPVRAGL